MATIKFTTDDLLKSQFEILCKHGKKDMTKAFNHFMEVCVINQINPVEIDILLKQSTRGLIQKYHDHTASFLKTMENTLLELTQKNADESKNRLEVLHTLIHSLAVKYSIEKTVTDEILYNSQLLIELEDSAMGKRIFEKNTEAILKKERTVLNTNKG